MVNDRRPKVTIELKKVQHLIPRNESGDPAFTRLLGRAEDQPPDNPDKTPCLAEVFTYEQIVVLANRQLYQMEYQYNTHQRRYEEEKDFRELVKTGLKIVAPGTSLAKATEEQIKQAVAAGVKARETEERKKGEL